MPTRVQVIAPVAAAAFVVGVVGLLTIPSDAKLESAEFPLGTVLLDGRPLEVQIADTDPRRVRGLMFQERLSYDEGMLFVFDEPGYHSLWMLNMQFSLDMVWFDESGRVVHIETGVEPCRTAVETLACPSRVPSAPALYVLEVSSGYVDEFGTGPDSVLELVSV